MTLLEQIKETKEKAKIFKASRDSASRMSDAREAEKLVINAQRNLGKASRIFNSLSGKTTLSGINVSKLLNSSNIIEEKMKTNIFSVSEAKSLEKDAEQIESNLEKTWDDYIKLEMSGISLIRSCMLVFVKNNLDYCRLVDSETEVRRCVKGSDEAFAALERYKFNYNKLLQSIQLSDRLMRFFVRLNEQKQISLRDLDMETIEELKKSKFAQKLILRSE